MTLSLAQRYAKAKPLVRRKVIANLGIEKQQQLAKAGDVVPWWWTGRPEQFAPLGDWRWWVICAGRGFGKTKAGAETVAAWCRRYPGARVALVAPTFGDGRDTMVEGVSGLLSCFAPHELRGGSADTAWNRSIGELILANGSSMKVLSSEKPRAIRGKQFHFVWGDEPSYWADVAVGTAKDGTFSNVNIALRLPAMQHWDRDYRPQGVLTMTPRMVPLLKVPDELLTEKPYLAGLLQRDDVHITTGKTMDNLSNLDKHYYDSVVKPLMGTALGVQELGGILLEEVDGALWTTGQLELIRQRGLLMPTNADLAKTVVAFDPAGGTGIGHDEHGIVVASSSGMRDDMALWVREDRSGNIAVEKAAERVILATYEFAADAIVYEKNQGQDWIAAVLKSTHATMIAAGKLVPKSYRLPTLVPVTAVKSKLQRATPVAALYTQPNRVAHVGQFPVLEGQMTTWVPGETDSPDRLDALVWAITWLYETGPSRAAVASNASRERRGRRPDMPSSRMPAVYGSRASRR